MKDIECHIINTISKANILPITSLCDAQCLFCSHRQNPPGIKVYSFGHRKYEDIMEDLDYLDRNKKIVIGESATRLIEGEPFLHPYIDDILKNVRMKYPNTPICVTTNGNLLTEKRVKILKNLNLELNLSINAASYAIRKKLMGKGAAAPVELLDLLYKFSIEYHGSLVALPWITGWKELKTALQILQEYGAKTTRIFLPGYTRLAPSYLRFDIAIWKELYNYVLDLRKEIIMPITLEPPMLKELVAEVAGVIRYSPAYESGIVSGDIILRVNNEKVNTRVEAFRLIKRVRSPEIEIKRGENVFKVTMTKKAGEASGLVMENDITPELVKSIKKILQKNSHKKILMLVSVAGYPIIRETIKKFFSNYQEQLIVQRVESIFFGGSIISAGLLVVEDFKKAWEEWKDKNPREEVDMLLLPEKAFDENGRDLKGTHYSELANYTECEVILL